MNFERRICLKRTAACFWAILAAIFLRIQNTNSQYSNIVDGFSFSLKCKKEKINQHKNICITSYDRIIDSMFYC